MSEALALEIAGARLLLLAEKAIYWPAQKFLFVADAHFGKAAAYRALGQPVPHGTTSDNLNRLDTLLERYDVSALIFLGDFLHAPKSHAPETLKAIQDWRHKHAAMECILIRGNHDLRAGDPPKELAIQMVDEPLLIEPFAFRHMPIASDNFHVIAGHLHPSFTLHGKGKQKLRLPCFHVTDNLTVLPAFGAFTGSHPAQLKPSSRIFMVEENRIWEAKGLNRAT